MHRHRDLTVDLDAIVANWRKLKKTGVPRNAPAWSRPMPMGCGAEQVARALFPTPAARHSSSPPSTRPKSCVRRAAGARIYVLNGFFQNSGEAYAKIDCKPVIGDSLRTRRMGRVLSPHRLERRRGNPYRHRHEPARPDPWGAPGIVPAHKPRRPRITLVMSHLAPPNSSITAECQTTHHLPRDSRAFFRACRHRLANSSGILGPHFQFDLVRPGPRSTASTPTPEADNPMLRWSN